MYEKYFYLKESPFNITPDTRFLHLTRKHREAIDLLIYGITAKKGFIMLTGEVGMGKTTLSRALLERLPKKVETALILNPLLSGHDLIKTITSDFGLIVEDGTIKAHLDKLNEFLLKTAESGATAAVIIDEAQNLPVETLETVRLLSNLETEREKLLQIVLVGQPELRKKLEMNELRQLNQRITVRYHLEPLAMDETADYIRSRIFTAGGGTSLPFTEKAIKEIYDKAAGIPRKINIICDRVLTAAYVYDKKAADEDAVEKALEELVREGTVAIDALKPATLSYGRYLPYIALGSVVIAIIAGIYLVL